MTILEGEILQNPQTWFTLASFAVTTILIFLFGPNGYLNKATESKEKKEERLESAKDAQILNLTSKVEELTAKLNTAVSTIHDQTIQIEKLTLKVETFSRQLTAINTYIEDTDPDNHIIKFIKNSTS